MQELSGVDAAFLYVETPAMHMHVLGVLLLDPSSAPQGFGYEKVRELLASRLVLIPEFRRRLSGASVRLNHPVWVDLIDVRVADHVQQVTLPYPGGQRELERAVADFAEVQLERSRPLWQVLVVEGLHDGRVAVVVKVHHCVVDGVAAGDILAQLVDLTPEGRTAEEVYEQSQAVAERRRGPGLPRMAVHMVGGVAATPVSLVKAVPTVTRSLVNVVRTRRGGESAGGALPFTAPRAPWNGTVTPRRTVALVDVPMEQVKAVRRALGGTFNDVMMAVCGGAFRRFLLDLGEPVEESLVAVLPVSVRSDGDSGGNRTSAMFGTLATHVADPVERLHVISAATLAAKAEQRALGNEIVDQVGALAQPLVVSLAARAYGVLRLANRHPVIHNMVLSNVPGPPIPLYLAGARIDSLVPLGPVLDGAGLNVTVVSYADRVGVGVIGCGDLAPDLRALAEHVQPALDELVKAAGL